MKDNGAALTAFLSQRAALIRYARTITGDAAEAEDLVQEAWLRFNTIAAKRAMAEPMGYLRMTVRNLALNGRSRKRVEARIFDSGADADVAGVPSDLPSPEAAVIARDEYARILEALAAMPESMRIAVEMHRFGGKRLKDIAAHLGISITTAHTLVLDGIDLCRARTDRAPE